MSPGRGDGGAGVWDRLTRTPLPSVMANLNASLRENTIRLVKSRDISRAELERVESAYELAKATVNSDEVADRWKEVMADRLVFPGKDNFLKDSEYRAVFDKAAAKIGVKGLTQHELRHTCGVPGYRGRRQRQGRTEASRAPDGVDDARPLRAFI